MRILSFVRTLPFVRNWHEPNRHESQFMRTINILQHVLLIVFANIQSAAKTIKTIGKLIRNVATYSENIKVLPGNPSSLGHVCGFVGWEWLKWVVNSYRCWAPYYAANCGKFLSNALMTLHWLKGEAGCLALRTLYFVLNCFAENVWIIDKCGCRRPFKTCPVDLFMG